MMCPRSADEVTPEWLAKEEKRARIHKPVSIFWPPNPAASGHNTGHILVAITTCCRAWNLTLQLLNNLIAIPDPVHVVLFDDHSTDGLPQLASAMGFPVFTTARITGNTWNMKRAWWYFSSYSTLQSMYIMNNDITVMEGTFTKLDHCLMTLPFPGMCTCTQKPLPCALTPETH